MRRPQLTLIKELVAAFPEALTQRDARWEQIPLHHLLQHAGEGQLTLELVQLLSADGASAVLSTVNFQGQTPLHIFLSRSAPQLELDVLQFLCDACPSAVIALDKKERNTLICLAAASGSMDVASVLLERAPALSAQTTRQQESALFLSAQRMNATRLPLFLHLLKLHPQHAGILLPSKGSLLFALLRSLLNSDSDSAAVDAADPASMLVACKALLAVHPSLRLTAMEDEDELPIHIVARMALATKAGAGDLTQRDFLCLLLETDAAQQLAACHKGKNMSLHYLAANANRAPGCFELLIQAHPAAASVIDADGRTVAQLLCSQPPGPSAAEVQCLVAAAPGCFAIVDKEGCTPLHLLCRQTSDASGSCPSLSLDAVRAVLSAHPVAATMQNAEGQTALMSLCERWSIPAAVTLLVEAASQSPMPLDKRGRSALDYACKAATPSLEVLQMLLNRLPQPSSPSMIAHALHSLCANSAVTPELIVLLLKVHPTAAMVPAKLDVPKNLPLHVLLRMPGNAAFLVKLLPVHLYLRRTDGRDSALLQLLMPSVPDSEANPSASSPSLPFSAHLTWSSMLDQLLSQPSVALLTAEELRILVARMPRATKEDVYRLVKSRHCTPSVFAVLMELQAETKWPLACFSTLFFSHCLTLDMVRGLVSVYPADAGNSVDWHSRRWHLQPAWESSALESLLGNRYAHDSPDFAAMLQLVATQAPPDKSDRYCLDMMTDAAVFAQLLQQKMDGHVEWPLRVFRSLMSCPFVTPNLIRALLLAYPSAGDRGADAAKWRKNWGPSNGSALHALLTNVAAVNSPDFRVMFDLLTDCAPDQITKLEVGDSRRSMPLLSFLCEASDSASAHLLTCDFVQMLQKHVPDVLAHGYLHAAFAKPPGRFHEGVLPWLLENTPRAALSLRNEHGRTPLHVLLACERVNATFVQLLLHLESAAAQDTLEDGSFPAHVLCGERGHTVPLLQLLYDAHPAAFTVASDTHSGFPLFRLCSNSNVPITVVELQWFASKPDLRVQFHQRHRGRTALIASCENNSLPIASLHLLLDLSDDAAALSVSEQGLSALHTLVRYVSAKAHEERVAVLLQRHPKLASIPGAQQRLPLHILSDNATGSAGLFAMLIAADPAAMHARDTDGNTPLQLLWRRRQHVQQSIPAILAFVNADVSVLQQLPDLIPQACTGGKQIKPAESFALLSGIVEALAKSNVQHRQQMNELLPLSHAVEMWPTLLRLCRESKTSIVPTLGSLLQLVPAMLIFTDGSNGWTLLHSSSKANHLDACKLLVEHGASVLAVDSKGLTAMQLAPVETHAAVHTFLAERQRLASMYRGRFEIDQNRAPLVSGGGKVKFAFDTNESSAVVKPTKPFPVAAKQKAAAVADSSAAAVVPAFTAAAVATPDASVSVRIPAVLKFYKDEAEFHTERDLYQRMSRMSRGLYIPRMLEYFEPLKDAAPGSDDALHCLAMEGGSESLRAQMTRRAVASKNGVYWSSADVLPMLSATVAALRFLHEVHGLVHADLKPENLVAFADDYRLIDFDSACEVDSPLSLAFTAHYTPPEQAKRVLASRSGQAVPELLADGSYDVWSLGALLLHLRCGRPLFDSQTGDRDADVVAILEAGAGATDESILVTLKELQKKTAIALQDNEINLLTHLLAVDPSERSSIGDVARRVGEMLQGLSATQKNLSMASAIRDVGSGVAAMHSDVRSLDDGQKAVVQHVKQVKVGVHMVAAKVDSVANNVDALHQKLEDAAQKTLRAIFDVHQTDMPRLFSLLPDHLDAECKPMPPVQWRNLKAQFSHAWADVSRQAEQAARDLMPFHYFRLTFICEAADRGGGCTAHSGYVVKQPTA
jgi:ankyrin repeat protein/serine/threonine protein kinase